MFEVTVKFFGVLLSICGVCPPSAVTNTRAPKLLDAVNMLCRLASVAAYATTNLFSPASISELKGSKTYKVVVILMRFDSLAHYVVALLLSPALGRCVTKILHLRLSSTTSLIPMVLYTSVILGYIFTWRNPFNSMQEFPVIFIYTSLISFNFVCNLHTSLIKIALQQHRALNRLLEQPAKHPIELEGMLARVALKRMQINKLVANVDEGVGPILAATVIALSLRLAFSIFGNFSIAVEMFSGKTPSSSTLILIFPRTLLESFTLVYLANAGQCLKNEAAKGQLLLDRIITSSHTLPPLIKHQVRKCYHVFAKDKLILSAWGLFSVDHTLILMIVSIIFALLMIQIQFLVSEIVSSS